LIAEAVSAYGLVADTILVVAITRRKGLGIFSVLGGKLNLTAELSQLYCPEIAVGGSMGRANTQDTSCTNLNIAGYEYVQHLV